MRYTQPDMTENLDWIKRKIKQEVFFSTFGMQEGFKVQLEADPQVQKAVEAIPAGPRTLPERAQNRGATRGREWRPRSPVKAKLLLWNKGPASQHIAGCATAALSSVLLFAIHSRTGAYCFSWQAFGASAKILLLLVGV